MQRARFSDFSFSYSAPSLFYRLRAWREEDEKKGEMAKFRLCVCLLLLPEKIWFLWEGEKKG
jgi:hypothetical protein